MDSTGNSVSRQDGGRICVDLTNSMGNSRNFCKTTYVSKGFQKQKKKRKSQKPSVVKITEVNNNCQVTSIESEVCSTPIRRKRILNIPSERNDIKNLHEVQVIQHDHGYAMESPRELPNGQVDHEYSKRIDISFEDCNLDNMSEANAEHMKGSQVNGNWVCHKCKVACSSYSELSQHVCEQVLCSICGVNVESISHLRDHLFQIHSMLLCACGFLGGRNEMVSHTCEMSSPKPPSETKKVHCPKCNFSTVSEEILKQHIADHDGEGLAVGGEMIYSCPKCTYVTGDGVDFQRHKRGHDTDKNQSLVQCDVCDFTANSLVSLFAHMRNHVNGNTVYKCDICNFSCLNINVIREHKLKHKKPTMFSCPLCQLKCVGQYAFIKHLKIHGNRLQCMFCNFVCSEKSDYEKHVRTHSKNNGNDTLYTTSVPSEVRDCPTSVAVSKPGQPSSSQFLNSCESLLLSYLDSGKPKDASDGKPKITPVPLRELMKPSLISSQVPLQVSQNSKHPVEKQPPWLRNSHSQVPSQVTPQPPVSSSSLGLTYSQASLNPQRHETQQLHETPPGSLLATNVVSLAKTIQNPSTSQAFIQVPNHQFQTISQSPLHIGNALISHISQHSVQASTLVALTNLQNSSVPIVSQGTLQMVPVSQGSLQPQSVQDPSALNSSHSLRTQIFTTVQTPGSLVVQLPSSQITTKSVNSVLAPSPMVNAEKDHLSNTRLPKPVMPETSQDPLQISTSHISVQTENPQTLGIRDHEVVVTDKPSRTPTSKDELSIKVPPVLHSCTFCTFKTSDIAVFDRHKLSHLKFKVIYTCTSCFFTSGNEKQYNQHKSRHPESSTYHTCVECSYTVTSRELFDKHTHDASQFHCDQCSFSCSESKSLEVHKRAEHAEITRVTGSREKVTVEASSLGSNSTIQIMDPISLYSSDEDEEECMMVCSMCSFASADAKILKEHEESHTVDPLQIAGPKVGSKNSLQFPRGSKEPQISRVSMDPLQIPGGSKEPSLQVPRGSKELPRQISRGLKVSTDPLQAPRVQKEPRLPRGLTVSTDPLQAPRVQEEPRLPRGLTVSTDPLQVQVSKEPSLQVPRGLKVPVDPLQVSRGSIMPPPQVRRRSNVPLQGADEVVEAVLVQEKDLFDSNAEDPCTLYNCNFCNFCTDAVDKIKEHTKAHIKEQRRSKGPPLKQPKEEDVPFDENSMGICKYCNFTSADHLKLQEHEAEHTMDQESSSPEEAPSIYNCALCNYSSSSVSDISEHAMAHIGDGELQPMKKKSKKNDALCEDHKLSHAKAEFMCKKCDFTVDSLEALIMHEQFEHSGTSTSRTSVMANCPMCSYSGTPHQVTLHFDKAHSAIPSKPNKKKRPKSRLTSRKRKRPSGSSSKKRRR